MRVYLNGRFVMTTLMLANLRERIIRYECVMIYPPLHLASTGAAKYFHVRRTRVSLYLENFGKMTLMDIPVVLICRFDASARNKTRLEGASWIVSKRGRRRCSFLRYAISRGHIERRALRARSRRRQETRQIHRVIANFGKLVRDDGSLLFARPCAADYYFSAEEEY